MLLPGPAWGNDRANGFPARRCGPEGSGPILTAALFAPRGPDALPAPHMRDITARGPRRGAASKVEHGTGISRHTRSTAGRSDALAPHPDCTGGRDTTEHPEEQVKPHAHPIPALGDTMPVDPLYKDAIDHFGVSASQVADLLNPALYDHLWPDDSIPVSLAWLAEVILTTAYAAKANRSADLAIFLAARDLSSPVHSLGGAQTCRVPPSAPATGR